MKMEDGAIAFLDVLGFKGIWEKRNPEDVLRIMQEATDRISNAFKKDPPKSDYGEIHPPDIIILSDTIVIAFVGPRADCLLYLSRVICFLFDLFFEKKLFLRGALGYGKFIKYENTFLGPVIDDVAAWYDEAKFIGVVSTPRTNYLIESIIPKTRTINGVETPFFIKYNVPCKDRSRYKLNCVNWPAVSQIVSNVNIKNKIMEVYSEGEPFDSNVFTLVENTLDFVDESIKSIRRVAQTTF